MGCTRHPWASIHHPFAPFVSRRPRIQQLSSLINTALEPLPTCVHIHPCSLLGVTPPSGYREWDSARPGHESLGHALWSNSLGWSAGQYNCPKKVIWSIICLTLWSPTIRSQLGGGLPRVVRVFPLRPWVIATLICSLDCFYYPV